MASKPSRYAQAAPEGTFPAAIGRMLVLIPRHLSRFIARLLIGALMLSQLAVAAYACQGIQGASGRTAGAPGTDVPVVRMAMDVAGDDFGHAFLDPAQPNLCSAHCQSGQQNADGKLAPSVPAFLPTILYPRVPTVLPADIQHASMVSDDPSSEADPPHAILHCCFRI